MAATLQQRWALGLSAILTELNQGHHHELGGWGAGENTAGWCRNVLRDSWQITDHASLDRTLAWLWNEGHRAESLAILARLPPDPSADDPKAALVRAHAADLRGRGLLAWDLGRFVAIVGWAAWAGLLPEPEAWRMLHGAATWAQRRYASWEELGRHYELGFRFWSGQEDPRIPAIRQKLLSDPRSPWASLAWRTALGAAPPAPAKKRVKRTVCRGCGAPKQLPPLTGWVYCDHCGTLIDWDFRAACDTPGSFLPGPAYEAIAAQLKPRIDAARAAGDEAAMRAVQRQLFAAWAEHCPASLPPRAKQPAYRAAYVDYLAEAAVHCELDPPWRAALAKVEAATRQVMFIGDPRKPRVNGQQFWPLADAVAAQVKRGMEVYAARGVIQKHPDGVPAEMQERLTWSMFAQGWLPYLPDADAEKLLARTGLGGDYVDLPPPAVRLRHCGTCNGELRTVPGAVCVVCEACGTRVDVKGDEVGCAQCGSAFSLPENAARAPCPACQAMVARV